MQMSPRARAIDLGAPTYEGMPCKNCGGTKRYVSNWGCTQCKQKRTSSAKALARAYSMGARKRALEAGLLTYEGQPCPRDGTVVRYTRNHECVACCAERRRRAQERDRPKVSGPPADIWLAQKKRDERQRLALIRAEATAKQRKAMGL